MDTKEKLNLLAEYMAQKDVLNLQKQELIDQVYTPEIRAMVADIEAEFAGKAQIVDDKISDMTDGIKIDVLNAGASVKGDVLHAVWTKGRVSWDSKKLEGLAIAIPAVLEARKEGEPSVSIRKI